MENEENLDLKGAFERYICDNCQKRNCTKNLLIQKIESKATRPVYSIKCSNYLKIDKK